MEGPYLVQSQDLEVVVGLDLGSGRPIVLGQEVVLHFLVVGRFLEVDREHHVLHLEVGLAV